MTAPGRLLDFFTLEAGEYLTRLERLVTGQTMQASDATHFAAAARGLRGSATMAKAMGVSDLAATVERIATGVVQGAVAWDPELQRALVGAVEDLKLLVRSVRGWSSEQDQRVRDTVGRLSRFAPAREDRKEDVIVPISQLFFNDNGQHIVYVAPTAKTHYEQQLREQGGVQPSTLSAEVKRAPAPPPTPSQEAPAQLKTPPRGKELRDVLNSSLATMRALESRNSGPQVPVGELVPIQELLYRGQRAIERAAEIRRALRKSGNEPTRALVDELVDLVELASAE
jgi:chemotaxis protein histidine kinase CheA